MPAPRTQAQIEAARRNGAKSCGPVSEEGKARSAMNALRHGLAAAGHLLTEGEDPAAWEELLTGLVAEHEPATELEGRLVHRLAAALWRQERADRMEQALFAAAPRPPSYTAHGVQHPAPEETFELARLDAIRRYRADASREVSKLVRELRQLRQERAAGSAPCRNEPERAAAAPAANGNVRLGEPRNEPEPAPVPDLTYEERLEVERMLTSGDPAQIVAGAARAGVLHAVPFEVARRAAAALGPAARATPSSAA